MDNDFVAMAQKMCPVCGSIHEHNAEILINKRFQKIDKDERITGYGLCEEHDKLFQDGYLALVVTDESKSAITKHEGNKLDTLKEENACRTGDLMHIRRTVFNKLFDTESPEDQEMVFIDIALFEKLKEMQEQADEIDP